ncbi:S8 family serine peptidase [Rhizobium paknamense]|uniref:Subtilisin family serine protease n=1 Tax=Rhizobium paknamense TaxID=1206817 RepID=A0ABU0I944_9HYPH|nr:S8 family serine peptidase [Rhizobium paknamense]MDQ0454750.1 subtilisin family serine protease [Rhizobium paknamense]
MTTDDANTGDPTNNPTRQGGGRFIISHRLAPYGSERARKSAKARFGEKFTKTLQDSVDILADSGDTSDDKRRVLVVSGDEAEMTLKSRSLSGDVLIEPESLRWPAALRLAGWANAETGENAVSTAGAPSIFYLRLTSGSQPVVNAKVELTLSPLVQSSASTSISAVTDPQGFAVFSFDQRIWQASAAQISPHGGYWSAVAINPANARTLTVDPLPKNGPVGWWHQLAGLSANDPQAGSGIRIGILDTGLGPHPYLNHITPAGAYVDGAYVEGAIATMDVEWHGTHVSGIIGARPPEGSGEFAGLAPGADIFTARVFSKNGGANQGDIAAGIDAMAFENEVDLINLSLGGGPSAIEYDAVLSAYYRGTLCICAAGNQYGQAVMSPANYPIAVAVTALGMPGTYPANNLAALTAPQQPDRIGYGGLYLPSYSNFGPQVAVTAAGSAVISTIPATEAEPAPYADMSGTSMATPVTTAALAVLLSQDPIFRTLARCKERADYARSLLETHAFNLGLAPQYQGKGLSRAI